MDDALDLIEEAAVTYNSCILKTDFCLGCNKDHAEHKHPVIIGIPVKVERKSYPNVLVFLCPTCIKKQDYNQVKRNLNYWLMESMAVKLNEPAA